MARYSKTAKSALTLSIVNSVVLVILIILIVLLGGCSPKYEVIQKLDTDRYHLGSVKGGSILIVSTSDSLVPGSIVKLKQIKTRYEIMD